MKSIKYYLERAEQAATLRTNRLKRELEEANKEVARLKQELKKC